MQRTGVPYDTTGTGDRRYSAGSQPGIWQERLYSLHLLGQKRKICGKTEGGRACRCMGQDPEPGIPETNRE